MKALHDIGCALLLGPLLCGCSGKDSSAAAGESSQRAFSDAELTAQKCSLQGTITSYTAGAVASAPAAGTSALVPCYQEFGIGSAEATMAVTKDGTVNYAPVFTPDGVGIHQTTDFGVTWHATAPKFPNGGSHGKQQPYLFRDADTDVMLFATTTASFNGMSATTSGASKGFDMTRSSDGWKSYSYSNVALETSDWMKIYSGPPVTSKTEGGPNIIYMSAPSPISTLSGEYQAIYRSLDSGATWASVGGKVLSLKVKDFPDCPMDGWIIYGNGAVGPDGTVYISLHRCGHLAIAISGDEGNTWSTADVPGTTLLPFIGLIQMVSRANALLTEPLMLDAQGNVYLVWPDEAGLLRFSVSTDKARTWTAPLVVSDPAVKYAVYGGVAVQKPGTVAIAYYGSEVGQPGPFNGYLAETTNALDAAPVFQSARMNDPAAPLSPEVFDVGYGRLFSGGDELHEIVKPVYAPNGDIWATFARDMCVGLGNEMDRCSWDAATLGNYQGSVGRLVHR